jgi:hypothetical protein
LVSEISYPGDFCLSAYAVSKAPGYDSDLYLGCASHFPGTWQLAFFQIFEKALKKIPAGIQQGIFFV